MGNVMKYYSVVKRNTIGSFVEMQMDLESVIPSEVSQKEKNKYWVLIHIYIWNLEKWCRWTYLQGRNRDVDIENGRVDTGEGEGGTNWESRIDIYTRARIKSITSGKLLYSTRSSAPYPLMTYRGGIGGGSGREWRYTHTHTHTRDSLHCVAETNTTL